MRPIHRRDLVKGAAAGLLLAGTDAGAQVPALTCGIMDTPPWLLQGDTLSGIAVDMVRLLSAHSGLAITPQSAPPVRVIKAVTAGLVDMVAYVQLPELDRNTRALGSIGTIDMGVVTRASLRPTEPRDLSGCTLGMMRGNKREAIMARLPDVKSVEVRDLSHGLSMIAAGRLDALLGSRLALAWHMRRAGLGTGALGPFMVLAREQLLVYLTLARPYSDDILARLTKAVSAVYGQVDELAVPYLRRV